MFKRIVVGAMIGLSSLLIFAAMNDEKKTQEIKATNEQLDALWDMLNQNDGLDTQES